MVKLRLRRRGRKKRPIYEIVATDSRKARDGEYLEKLGLYNPMPSPSDITVNRERALYWLREGAQPTKVVRTLLSSQGVLLELYMERKGKSAEEIAEALEKHKAVVDLRVQRILRKKSGKKEAAAETVEADAEASDSAPAGDNADAAGGETPAAESES